MKRFIHFLVVLTLSLSLFLVGCSKSENNNQSTGEKKLNVALYVHGTLGDKGFFDSANAGVEKAAKDLNIDYKTIEGGYNPADWPSTLESLAAKGEYDIIVVGTSDMIDITIDVANRYPNQKFVFYDEAITDQPNIYSVTYSQSEGSFLAGAFAALVTTSTELKGANPDKIIGFVGGVDEPIINDFLTGYEQGAHYIDPNIQVIKSYVGDWSDAPKGKELGLAQFNAQKADISYQVAGGAGLGLLEAGDEVGKYTIGVDQNQNGLFPGSVLTSMLKNVGDSIYRAIDLHKKGELKYGTTETLGIKEGGVGLAKDELYEQYVPVSIRDTMKEIEQKVVSGEITVTSILK